jgi:hypothetical protein
MDLRRTGRIEDDDRAFRRHTVGAGFKPAPSPFYQNAALGPQILPLSAAGSQGENRGEGGHGLEVVTGVKDNIGISGCPTLPLGPLLAVGSKIEIRSYSPQRFHAVAMQFALLGLHKQTLWF